MSVVKITNAPTQNQTIAKINEIIDNLDGGGSGGSSTLAELTDVSLTSPTNGQVLGYDGTDWVNTNTYNRQIGEIVTSTIPLTDAGLHLLDGTQLSGSGIYADFVDYIGDLYSSSAKVPNVEKIGSLSDTDCVLSGFSENNYAMLPSNFVHGNYPWEVQFKVTTGNDVTTQAMIYEQYYDGGVTGEYIGLTLYIQDSALHVRCGNGSTTIWRGNSSYSITANTTYLLKAEFTGTAYVLSSSSDNGTTWRTEDTVTSSTVASDNYSMHIGVRNGSGAITASPWTGSIDLTGCYIKVNNVITWEGTKSQIFVTEAEWQQSVTDYGVCGKFVYTAAAGGSPATVRLPLINGFTEGTITVSEVGDLVQAGIYGNSNTVQPQAIKVLYYVVVATSTKTDIQVDIDEIATDLNMKVDKSTLSEVYPVIETYNNGDSWYKIYAPDSTGYRWCVQGSTYYKGSTVAGDNTIIFLKTFADINFTFTAQILHSSTNLTCYAMIEKYPDRTVSGTKIYTTSAPFGYAWVAYGYIANEA